MANDRQRDDKQRDDKPADSSGDGKAALKPEGKRLFVGVRVSVQTANALAQAAETLQRRTKDAGIAVNWVAPVNYHATLKYLGFTRDDAIGAVRDALVKALAGVAPLKFRTARLGAFPSLEKASVLWAGVDGGVLDALAARIESAMVGIGYPAEERAFHAHVTLGRLRETRPVKDVVLPLSEQMFSDTRIDGVSLFESETKSSGSVYKEIHRVSFKPAETGGETALRSQTGTVELGDETDDGWPRGHSH
jgi:2'-5' RNA ligase